MGFGTGWGFGGMNEWRSQAIWHGPSPYEKGRLGKGVSPCMVLSISHSIFYSTRQLPVVQPRCIFNNFPYEIPSERLKSERSVTNRYWRRVTLHSLQSVPCISRYEFVPNFSTLLFFGRINRYVRECTCRGSKPRTQKIPLRGEGGHCSRKSGYFSELRRLALLSFQSEPCISRYELVP